MRKKNIDFDLTAYDYMNSSMRTEGWMWEFIRRNENYRTDFRIAMDKLKMLKDDSFLEAANLYDYFKKKYSLALQAVFDSIDSRGQQLLKDTPVTKYKKFFDVLGIWYPPDPNLTWLEILPDYDKCFYFSPTSPVYAYTSDELRSFGLIDGADDSCYAHFMNESMVHRDKKTTLYMSIDLSAVYNLDQLMDIIRKEIAGKKKELGIPETKSPKIPKSNKDKDAKGDIKRDEILNGDAPIWKSYLIVYDLINGGMSFKEACDLLGRYAEDRYGEEITVRRHFNEANKLIFSGYKKFI